MIAQSSKKEEKETNVRPSHSNVDEVIVFKQLRDKSSLGIMIDIDDNTAIEEATGTPTCSSMKYRIRQRDDI